MKRTREIYVGMLRQPNSIRRYMSGSSHSLPHSVWRGPTTIFSNNSIYFHLLTMAHNEFKPHWKSEPVELRDCTIVSPPYWLDQTHPDYGQFDWGHSMIEMPLPARIIAKQMYPNYPVDRPVTWLMFRKMRECAKTMMNQIPGITYHEDTPVQITKSPSNSYSIDLLSGVTIGVPENTSFINWWRIPARHGIAGLIQRSHLDLYCQPLDRAPEKLIVFGSGLSILWLAKHFPRTQIISVKLRDQIVPKNPRVPIEDLKNLLILNSDEIDFESINDQMIIRELATGKKYQAPFYQAIGFKPNNDFFKHIPGLTVYSIESIEPTWIAPEVLPEGSLLESVIRWHVVNDTVDWTFEPMSYHKNQSFPTMIQEGMRNMGIELKVEFFNKLEESILRLRVFPSEEGFQALFHAAFDIQNPTADEKVVFEKALKQVFHIYTPSSPTSSFWKKYNPIGKQKRDYSVRAVQSFDDNPSTMREALVKLIGDYWYQNCNYIQPTQERVQKFRSGKELELSLRQTDHIHKSSKY